MAVVRYKYKNGFAIVSVNSQPYSLEYDVVHKRVNFIRSGDITVLASNIDNQESAQHVMDDFIDLYITEMKTLGLTDSAPVEAQKTKTISNWWVALGCLVFVIAYSTNNFFSAGPSISPDEFKNIIKSTQAKQQGKTEELHITDEGVDMILKANITDRDIEEIKAGKKQLLKILATAKTMSASEKKAYFQTAEVRSILDKKWAKNFLN